jgi:hypothetical protein
MYNFDEKGFLIGLSKATQRVIPIIALTSGKLLGVIQDEFREFISLLACTRADGTLLPPALIYQAESGDLQDI